MQLKCKARPHRGPDPRPPRCQAPLTPALVSNRCNKLQPCATMSMPQLALPVYSFVTHNTRDTGADNSEYVSPTLMPRHNVRAELETIKNGRFYSIPINVVINIQVFVRAPYLPTHKATHPTTSAIRAAFVRNESRFN